MSDSDSSSDSESSEEQQTVAKTAPAVEADSASSDSSSDEEEEEVQRKPTPQKDDDSSDDSSSDEEEEEAAAAPKTEPKVLSSSDDSSDDDDDEVAENSKAAQTKEAADDSSDDSSDGEDEPTKTEAKSTPQAADSSDSSDSEDEEKEKPKKAEEKMEVEEAEVEEAEAEFEPVKSKGSVTILFQWELGKEVTPRKRKLSTPSLPAAKKQAPEKAKPAAASSGTVTIEKEYNPDDFRSAELKDQTDTIFVKGIDTNAYEKDIKEFFTEHVAEPVSIRHKWEESRPGLAWVTFATNEQASKAVIDCNGEYIKSRYVFTDWAKPQNSGGGRRSGPRNAHLKDTTNRVWVGNLHREVDKDSLRAIFTETGEPTDVYILAGDGTRPQIAFISFETNEVASQVVDKLQGTSLMGNNIRLDWAEPRRDSGGRGTKRKQELSEKPEGCVTCFVGRLADTVDDEKLMDLFKDSGEIESIRYMERDGEFKGVAFVQFTETEATDKATQLNGTDFLGKQIRVDFAADRKKREY